MSENDCIFCRIVAGKLPSEMVFENERLIVFKDINPHAPVHLLIVPRKHIRGVNDLDWQKDSPLVAEMLAVARQMAVEEGIDTSGYKLLFNVEKGGGQVIFHLHLHLMGGWKAGD